MKTARKVLALIIVLMMTISCLSVSAFAASDKPYTIKIYCGNAPQTNLGSYQALDFIFAGALAFKNYCEKYKLNFGFVRDKDGELFINNTEYHEDMSDTNWKPLSDVF